MPNYVTNIIKFKNQKAFDLFRKTYIEATEDGGEVFDFNKLIPMPPKLKIESGSLTDDGIDYVIREMLRSGFPGIESIVVDRVEEILRRQRPFGYSRPTDADLDEKVGVLGRRQHAELVEGGERDLVVVVHDHDNLVGRFGPAAIQHVIPLDDDGADQVVTLAAEHLRKEAAIVGAEQRTGTG